MNLGLGQGINWIKKKLLWKFRTRMGLLNFWFQLRFVSETNRLNWLVACLKSHCSSFSQMESSVSRSGSSLSLARVRPGPITNGTNKHATSCSSSGAPSSSSGHKAQRSASTYHRQRRHSDFCKGKILRSVTQFSLSYFWIRRNMFD